MPWIIPEFFKKNTVYTTDRSLEGALRSKYDFGSSGS